MISIDARVASCHDARPSLSRRVRRPFEFSSRDRIAELRARHGPGGDEAHFNFHTVEGCYRPFAELLRRDGYAVRGSNAPFTPNALADANILVIANAIAEDNVDEWTLPNPSAFGAAEIEAVCRWVASLSNPGERSNVTGSDRSGRATLLS